MFTVDLNVFPMFIFIGAYYLYFVANKVTFSTFTQFKPEYDKIFELYKLLHNPDYCFREHQQQMLRTFCV
jgi:hypothetical protein